MLKQRFITAIILAPLVLCGVFLLDPNNFAWFFVFITLLATWEWANLSSIESPLFKAFYAVLITGLLLLVKEVPIAWVLHVSVMWWFIASLFVLSFPDTSHYWRSRIVRCVMGVFVLLPMWKALVFIRSGRFIAVEDLSTLWLIMYMLMLVWVADTGAYFAGKTWGNAKLAPNVSPGKSWAGAWGGIVATMILSLIASSLIDLDLVQTCQLLLITVITAGVSIMGDLTESMFKRQRGIKDSSNLLPGHGGVLDRIDSLVAAIPVFVFCLALLGWME